MSEEKDIRVGQLPSTFLKWGRMIIFLVFVVLVAILLGLRTTKVIRGPIEITSVAEPHDLYARLAGTFRAEVRDGAHVRQNQRVGFIEGNYRPDRIVELSDWLNGLHPDTIIQNPGSIGAQAGRFRALQGGPLLEAYTSFLSVSEELEQIRVIEEEKIREDIAALDRQIEILRDKLGVTQKSDSLLKERSTIQADVIRRSERLLNDSVIAQNELDREYLDQLESDYEYILNQTALPEIRSDIVSMQKERMLIRYEHELRKNRFERKVRMRYTELVQVLEDWIYEHIITTPIAGECVLSRLEPRYEVQPQQVVAKIVPADSSALIGRFKAPPHGISKIEIGAPVRVKLDAYPYLEYGAVFGRVKSISKVPFRGQYNVSVEFPQGLKTNYDYTLEFTQTLNGHCEVILDKSNMFEKIVQVIRWQEKVY